MDTDLCSSNHLLSAIQLAFADQPLALPAMRSHAGCPPGQAMDADGSCQQCTAGSASPGGSGAVCAACAAGSFADPSSTTCLSERPVEAALPRKRM
jgi:hypothetical protein